VTSRTNLQNNPDAFRAPGGEAASGLILFRGGIWPRINLAAGLAAGEQLARLGIGRERVAAGPLL
jgi:hypothetical protein